jgi:hypothetical protein
LGQPADVKFVKIATFYGKASGTKDVVNKLTGDIHQPLTGNFVGINHIDHDREYQSGILYLQPQGLHEQLLSAIHKLVNEGDEIDFAVSVNAVRSNNAAGYSYEAVSLLPPVRAADPLEALRNVVRGNFKVQLTEGKPAPPAEEEETQPPAKQAPPAAGVRPGERPPVKHEPVAAKPAPRR